MKRTTKKIAALLTAAVLASSFAAPVAFAGGNSGDGETKQKCNSGRGNGSEGCDPGNSSTSPDGSTGQNQGGDEGGPIRGGTGAP
jgi:hypothetical protein